MDGGAKLEPRRTAGEAQELASIEYFLAQLESMRARDLISPEAHARIVAETAARRAAIERDGLYRGAMATALGLAGRNPKEALVWAERARAIDSEQSEAWWMAYNLLIRLGRRDDAIALCAEAAGRFPAFRTRLEEAAAIPTPRGDTVRWPSPTVPAVAPKDGPAPLISRPLGPSLPAWSSIAGEFLEEHWQKLILCLAVLLIVVSSTVGAHLVLGPNLWSPVGKCALAVIYTVMFAGFGLGLSRWGAERAGRMMLVTTLVVVPVNFMLAGEMRLLIAPTGSRLLVLALDILALFHVSRRVAMALDWGNRATFLAASLVALSACDAATASGVPFALGLIAYLIPPWIFLGAAAWLNTREPGEDRKAQLDFQYQALGLLTFAFLSGVFRTAVILKLTPSLMALPVMITAMACVHAAHHLIGIEKDSSRVMTLRFGGLVLSALAFALALARPPGPSALQSANTVATAMLGLSLYASALAVYRQPVYLYLAFGALVVGYFGAIFFVGDLVRSVEDTIRLAFGYRQKLPFSFKALHGLVFNGVVGLLALGFSRRWRDARLARHCHYLGVPLSLAASILSGFEARAAVLCLSGYAVLYTLAAWLFRQPLVVYLASAAATGALAFGSVLIPDATLGFRALRGVLLAWGFRGLGGVLTWRQIDERYRRPLIHWALGLALAGMVAAGISAQSGGPVELAATLAFAAAALLCVLLVGELPFAPLAHATTAGVLGVGLCLFSQVTSATIRSPAPYGLVTAFLAALWPVACGGARRRFGETTRVAVFSAAVPDAVSGLVLLSVVLGVSGLASWTLTVAATLALGASALLGATRFRRARELVDLGLGFAAASALVLGSWRVDWSDPAVGLARLALSGSLAALLAWGAGVGLRRVWHSEFYAGPCLRAALALTAVVFALAVDSRLLSRAAFPAAAVALLVNGLVHALLAMTWRLPSLTYLAVGSVVSATYLALFSAEHPDPEKAYVLGLVAVLEALGFWALGMRFRRSKGRDADRVFGTPLLVWSLVLTLLSIPPALDSAVTMALASVAFLLLVKSFPSTLWVYGALGTLALAFDDAFLKGLSRAQAMEAAVAAAFGLWILAIVVERIGPRLCRRLGLIDLPYAYPVFHAAVASALAAAVLRLELTLSHGVSWTAHASVPVAMSLFCLLMIKPYPGRGWVHGFAALATVGLAMAAGSWITSIEGWLLAAMVLALAWLALGKDLFRIEPLVVERFGLEEIGSGPVLEAWSAFLALVATVPAAVLVGAATASAFAIGSVPVPLLATVGTPALGLTLGLAWLYLAFQGGNLGEDRRIAVYSVQTLLVWWVGVSRFLHGWGIDTLEFDPLATASLALATAWFGSRGRIGVDVSARRVEIAERFAFGLAFIASIFTRMEASYPTAATLMLATSVFGLQAVGRHGVAAAYGGALTWSGACVCLLIRLSGAGEVFDDSSSARLAVALGLTVGWLGLWWAAGRLRRTTAAPGCHWPTVRGRVVRALEQMALLGSLVAVGSALTMPVESSAPVDLATFAGLGVILAAAVLHLLLARCWESEWLVYTAQATILLAYLDYRHAYPLPVATDAAVLTFLGYLDLGIAEVMQRLRMNLYARPTLYVSLVLPLIPVATGLVGGRLDDLSLFLLFSTTAFYAVACYTRQWKTLGYAAAVMLNAVLWIAWSRVGWRLTDHPQFFLIPVGFSAILFAEVNRRELGSQMVNTIRMLGLLLIYFSLAMPVWQFRSFGAWLTLLVLSLAGILAGIGLRIQSFLWIGLIGFVLDVVYQLGRMGAENALARWGIMLGLGILLILFVALNEKKRIVTVMRQYYEQARQWQ